MSQWRSAKARKVLAALLRIGWTIKQESRGSHRILSRSGWPDVVFAFHDREEIGLNGGRSLRIFCRIVRTSRARDPPSRRFGVASTPATTAKQKRGRIS